jgi:hypothetical protein
VSKTERIYTLDIETDPFVYGRLPKAFQIGFYDGEEFTEFWGDDCIEKMFHYLQNVPPGIIYAHNGGRFDVLGYLMDWILGHPMRVINNRVAKCSMKCGHRHFHEIRDSYCLYPFKLEEYKGRTQKKKIEINKLENNECWEIETEKRSTSREIYREEITEYLKYDCMSLHELVVYFRENIGHELTVGAAAIKALKSFHEFKNLDTYDDLEIRRDYFYGGRVDCLQSGVLEGRFKLYDVNSMYPYVMAFFEHPIGDTIREELEIMDDTFFVSATGWNKRAFPVRGNDGGLDYTVEYGTFHVSIHEWEMAEKLGLFKCEKILKTLNCEESGNFHEFVLEYHNNRKRAQNKGNEIEATCLKYLLNSSYGKFAQNPEHYKDYEITRVGENPSTFGEWEVEEAWNMDGEEKHKFNIWTKPSVYKTRFNVATGASITGAARSVLMEAIHKAKNPVYCDTDSLLCEDLPLEKDATRLGAWKLEAEVDTAAIAGKKLYAFYEKGLVVKKAHKGFRITGEQIMRVAKGELGIVSENPAPTFKLSGEHTFVKRRVRRTV